MKKIVFDHSKETLNETIGISNERMTELNNKAIEVLEEADNKKTLFELVEAVLNLAETEEERIPLLLSCGALIMAHG